MFTLGFLAGLVVGGAVTWKYCSRRLLSPNQINKHPPAASGANHRPALPPGKPRVIVRTDEKAAVIELERAKQQGWDPISSV